MWLLAALVACVATSADAAPALADATVQVTGPSMTTGCTLPDAISFADNPSVSVSGCSQPGIVGSAGTITINVPAGNYVLSASTAPLVFSSPATVVVNGSGSGTTGTVIGGAGTVEPIHVESGEVTISGVRVDDGYSGVTEAAANPVGEVLDGNPGGGIDNAGSLTLNGDVVTGNTTGAGGEARCFTGSVFRPCPEGQAGGTGGDGGGIYNIGSLTITDSTISDNRTGAGGFGQPGLAASGTTAAEAGGVGGGGGAGGGIFSSVAASLQITDSTVTGNTTGPGGAGAAGGAGATGVAGGFGGSGGAGGAGGSGAGVYGAGPTSISASTINSDATGAGAAGGAGGTGPSGTALHGGAGSGGSGGGLAGFASLTLQDSTIADNHTGAGGANGTGGEGGGVAALASVSQPLYQDTIAGNATGGGGDGGGIAGGSVVVGNSIVASNSPSNCAGGVSGTTAVGSSTDIVFGDGTCSGFTLANPELGSLADNGGPTETMALGAGSAALDFDPTNSCPLTVDQRGIARPQPGDSGCDAGAYEHALPVISSVGASAPAPTTATVTAQINPELSGADTSVVVDYGITSAYGSSAPAQTIARGSAPVAFSASLSGLQPDTTYHYRLVATNGDPIATDGTAGQTVSGDATFTTPTVPPPPPGTPALAASVGAVRADGSKAKLTISCSGGGAGAVCSGPITLTSHETVQGRRILAVAASAKPGGSKKGSKKKKVSKLMTVATSSYSLPSGQSKTISVSLNRSGRALLSEFYKLPATVNVGGSATATAHIGFSYPRIKALILYTARFNGHGVDTVGDITISGIPKGSAVKFACQKGSCSPRSQSFKLKKGSRLSLGATAVVLKPEAAVAFEVTHTGQVGHVLEVTDVGPGAPQQSVLCLPPGARKPTRCA